MVLNQTLESCNCSKVLPLLNNNEKKLRLLTDARGFSHGDREDFAFHMAKTIKVASRRQTSRLFWDNRGKFFFRTVRTAVSHGLAWVPGRSLILQAAGDAGDGIP